MNDPPIFNLFVIDQRLIDFVESFCLGGTKIGNAPYFYWMGRNEAIGFSDWLDHMPNNYLGNEGCIEMHGDNNQKWNDVACYKPNFFVCEEEFLE